eukprot:3106380-Amphidinium_carterae.2
MEVSEFACSSRCKQQAKEVDELQSSGWILVGFPDTAEAMRVVLPSHLAAADQNQATSQRCSYLWLRPCLSCFLGFNNTVTVHQQVDIGFSNECSRLSRCLRGFSQAGSHPRASHPQRLAASSSLQPHTRSIPQASLSEWLYHHPTICSHHEFASQSTGWCDGRRKSRWQMQP